MHSPPRPPTHDPSSPIPRAVAFGHHVDDDPVLGTIGPPAGAGSAGSAEQGRWCSDPSADADVLADLFLGEVSPADHVPTYPPPEVHTHSFRDGPGTTDPRTLGTSDAGVERQPRVEALIIGHLPVLGSAWITGYARRVAARAGRPVALLRLRGGYLTIDLVGVGPPSGSTADAPSIELAKAIECVAATADHWIVCTDATDEPALVRTSEPDQVTLLTGGDNAAVVAAYQAIKGLLDESDGSSGWRADAELTISLAGSPPEQARRSADKIRSAVRAFLGRDIGVDLGSQRIEPGPSRQVFAGEWDGDVADAVGLLRERSTARLRGAAPCPDGRRGRQVTTADRAQAAPPPATIHESVAERGSIHAAPGVQPVFASLIDGLAPIGLRCPYEPGVEFATGADGRLHLVAAADGLASLTRAWSWARAHAALIRAAYRVNATPPDDPVPHVVAEDPASLRPLIETTTKAHLLVRVSVAGQGVAITRPLN